MMTDHSDESARRAVVLPVVATWRYMGERDVADRPILGGAAAVTAFTTWLAVLDVLGKDRRYARLPDFVDQSRDLARGRIGRLGRD